MADEVKKNKKHFFKDMKTELKKVTWLTPKQLTNNTVAVLVMVVIVAVIVFVLDFTFEKASSYGIEGLKSVVSNSITNEVTNTVDEDIITDTNTSTTEIISTDTNTVVENSESETQE